jgi:hypothetical protein
LGDAAQPRDVRGLPREVYASRDRIVRAKIKGIRINRPSDVTRGRKKGGGMQQASTESGEAEKAQIRNAHL